MENGRPLSLPVSLLRFVVKEECVKVYERVSLTQKQGRTKSPVYKSFSNETRTLTPGPEEG